MKIAHLGVVAAACIAVPAMADPVSVQLGASSETFTLYGLGPSISDISLGTFGIGQGASVYDPVTDTSTFTLSGVISGGTTGYDSGTYSFITTYAGTDTPLAGPLEPTGQSNPGDISQFFYTSIDPSTTMSLVLNLPTGTFTQALFENDNFVPNSSFSFAFTNAAACTVVADCTQNNVGLTPGATIYGPVTLNVSFDVPGVTPGVPETATWAMLIFGMGAIGAMMRRKRAVRPIAIA